MNASPDARPDRIHLLDDIRNQGKTWDVLAPRYGVTNENPPWKSSLVAICGCLGTSESLPALAIRQAEDQLADSVYHDVPNPERQLLALAHTMLDRGLVTETELAHRMARIRARLEEV
jgi:hypothetical protein